MYIQPSANDVRVRVKLVWIRLLAPGKPCIPIGTSCRGAECLLKEKRFEEALRCCRELVEGWTKQICLRRNRVVIELYLSESVVVCLWESGEIDLINDAPAGRLRAC